MSTISLYEHAVGFREDGKVEKAADRCPICHSNDVATYIDDSSGVLTHETLGSGRRNVSPGIVLRCRVCGFGFSRMRQNDATLAQLYSELGTEVYNDECAGRARTARRHLAIVQRWHRKGRLLDVGCGAGQFLGVAAAAGWQVVGVEPSQAFSAVARQHVDGRGQVICTTLQEADLPIGSFDVVTMWDVLEHVADPAAFLGHCRDLTQVGGYVIANVPHINSLPARLLSRQWPLLLPEHLNYFTRSNLRDCGEQAGLGLRQLGQRPAWFSMGYVASRISQHAVPGSTALTAIAEHTPLGRILFPVWLGELYAVWQRAN